MRWGCYIAIILLGLSCKKREIGPQFLVEPLFKGEKVLILNEGNFGWGNSSITAYDPATYQVANGVYNSANNLPLGDVCQSGIRWGGYYLIVVNNSNKIEILDTNTLEISDELSALGSPRYVLPGQNGIAYVSDLYANELGVVDIVSGEFATTIPVPGWVEEMVYANGSLYGTCPSNDCLVRVDTATNSLLETISVEAGPASIVKDCNEVLWTLSSGFGSVPARLSVIDPTTNNVVRVLEFDGTVQPAQLKINGAGDELYYIYGSGVCRMSIEATEVVSEAFIEGYGQTLYGLAVQPETGEIYLTDAKDFIQPGQAYRFSNTGQLLDSASCGIIPQSIVF